MWIRTTKDELLNLDRVEAIWYEEKYDVTQAWINSRCCDICEGNHVSDIVDAILKNRNFVNLGGR